jgi:hypothetical protein
MLHAEFIHHRTTYTFTGPGGLTIDMIDFVYQFLNRSQIYNTIASAAFDDSGVAPP